MKTPLAMSVFPAGWDKKPRLESTPQPRVAGRFVKNEWGARTPAGVAVTTKDFTAASLGPLSTVDSVTITVPDMGDFVISRDCPYFGASPGQCVLTPRSFWSDLDLDEGGGIFGDSIGFNPPVLDVIFWDIPPSVIPAMRAPIYRSITEPAASGDLVLVTSGRLWLRIYVDNQNATDVNTITVQGATARTLDPDGTINESEVTQLATLDTFTVAAGACALKEISLADYGVTSCDLLRVQYSPTTPGENPYRVTVEARD